MIFFAHRTTGAGKSYSTSKIEKIALHEGNNVLVVWPTGMSATSIDGRTTTHDSLQTKTDCVT